MIVSIDLSLTSAQKTALQDALGKLETYLTSAKIRKVLAVWPRLSDEQRAKICCAAPLFARLVRNAEKLAERVT